RGLSAAVCATPAGYGHQRMPPVADLWPGAWLMAVVIAAQRVMDRAPDQAAIVVDNYSHLRFTSPRRLKVCSYAFAMPSPIAKSAKRMRMARARSQPCRMSWACRLVAAVASRWRARSWRHV